MANDFRAACITYLTTLRAIRASSHATDELSFRAALDNLLHESAKATTHPVSIIGEAKKVKSGKPDFTITVKDLPIGYIEAEAYNIDLDRLTGHAKTQNEGFRANLDNFLLTNHLEFRLYLNGQLVANGKLPVPLDKGTPKITDSDLDALNSLFDRFFSGALPPIASPRDLAMHLARRTRQLQQEVFNALSSEKEIGGELTEIFEAFKETLLPDLTPEAFADMYAQTIAYGLFAARCAVPNVKQFSRLSAGTLVPRTNPFLRRMFQRIAALDFDERVAWIADDIAQLLALAPISDILADFGKKTMQEDPIVHFYETFLVQYDAELRDVRGVYYTPEPVVSFIVRSVDDILKTTFHKPLGLADEQALILDPATGTGSFMFTIVKLVREVIQNTYGAGSWNGYVEKKLLPRLFGFEILVAPYAVAHLKLGLLLQETGYTFTNDQRVGVYLTNTLEQAIKKSELLFGKFISDEANQAADIKRERPILAILGNPPYSGVSANASRDIKSELTFIGKLIEDYKQADGIPLRERKHWLQNDYVKFIRFGQWRVDRTGEGIVSYITDNSYLNGPTFRGMRRSLMQSFSTIYILNLHGNSKKKEKTPEGGKDENVFDIQQGVSILLCVKQQGNSQIARIFHADLWGLREDKYIHLAANSVNSVEWTEIQPIKPFYLFVPQTTESSDEYQSGWKITDIMPVNNSGFVTARDYFVIDTDKDEVMRRIEVFADPSVSDDTVRQTYFAGKGSSKYEDGDTRGWKLPQARKKVQADSEWRKRIHTCLYRPFDERAIYWTEWMVDWPRTNIMRHMFVDNNIALSTSRNVEIMQFEHVFCTNKILSHHATSLKEVNYIFPLYLYPEEGKFTFDIERRLNYSPSFLNAFANKLNLPQVEPSGLPEGVSPEDIFYYMYAILHSPTYRTRYAAFLKLDFPRLPLTDDIEFFHNLADLGGKLVLLHLLDDNSAPKLTVPTSPFAVSGTNVVERPTYDELQMRVYINKSQYFANVAKAVWEFQIGGYQVCEKWLKDRKERVLSIDDIQHYQQIIIALTETIRTMDEIDDLMATYWENEE